MDQQQEQLLAVAVVAVVDNIPVIRKTQMWCCVKGCGECNPIADKFETFREESFDGKLIQSKTEDIWVSDCCKAGLLLWDSELNGFIDHTYATIDN